MDFNTLDDFYYNHIKNLALMYCLANNKEIPFEKLKDLYIQIRNTEVYDNKKISYIPLENYIIKWEQDGEEKEFFIFNTDTLQFIETTFNTLLYLEKDRNLEDLDLDRIICNPFVDNQITDLFLKENTFTPSLWNTVFYYTFLVFINDRENEKYSKEAFKQWLRYTRNIIYNTYIQSPENFSSALKQIKNLEPHKFDISSAILNNEVENVFFENSQFEEEKMKLDLLKKPDWQEPIFKTENHPYFFGQIKFILDFSKDESNHYVLKDFIKYSNAISVLYGNEIRLHPEKILERFLLCNAQWYFPYYKSNWIFCSGSLGGLRTKNENWRLFFKGDKVNVLKDLIGKLGNKEITCEYLQDYIDDFLNTQCLKKSDARYLFLTYPKVIEYCRETAIRWNSDYDIRLLKGFLITAYHCELRTYCFFLENKNAIKNSFIAPEKYHPFTRFYFFEEKNTDGHSGFYIEGFKFKNDEYRLDVRYSKSKDQYELCFYHKVEDIENRKLDIDLSDLGFIFNQNYKQYNKIVLFTEIDNELLNLCKKLKSITQ